MAFSVALLGCEHPHLPEVLGVIASEPDVRLAAVYSADHDAIPGAIAAYAVGSADTAIGRADAVIVGASVRERPQLCVRAARAGRPVLVTAPVAATAAEAAGVAREIARSRTPAYANLFLRQLPALGQLRGLLRADVLGRVTTVAAGHLSAAALNGSAARRTPRAGADAPGAMTTLGLDLVDALAALGTRPRLDAVRLDRRRGAPADTGGVAVGRWGDVPLSLRTSSVVRPGGVEVTVNGTVATAVLRDGTLEVSSDLGAPERWIGSPPDPAEGVRHFFARLRTRRLDLNGLRDAVAAHEVIEGAAAM